MSHTVNSENPKTIVMLKIFSFPVSHALHILAGVSGISAIITMVNEGASQAFAGLFFAALFFFIVGKINQ